MRAAGRAAARNRTGGSMDPVTQSHTDPGATCAAFRAAGYPTARSAGTAPLAARNAGVELPAAFAGIAALLCELERFQGRVDVGGGGARVPSTCRTRVSDAAAR